MQKWINDLQTEAVKLENIPFRFRTSAQNGGIFIRCGKVRRGGNEPYCYTKEKCCAGHICRVFGKPHEGKYCVDRDDGTAWSIDLAVFEDIARLIVNP